MIKDQIFMGNGKRTAEEIKRLHEKLDEALSVLSGIQQAPSPTAPKSSYDAYEQEVEKGAEKIAQIAGQIYLALTGAMPVGAIYEIQTSDDESPRTKGRASSRKSPRRR